MFPDRATATAAAMAAAVAHSAEQFTTALVVAWAMTITVGMMCYWLLGLTDDCPKWVRVVWLVFCLYLLFILYAMTVNAPRMRGLQP